MKPFAILDKENNLVYFSSKENAIRNLGFDKSLDWQSHVYIETKFGYITIAEALQRKATRK